MLLWKNGAVSAASTSVVLLNSSNSRCPNGGGRSSVLPNDPKTVGICPKPPSRGSASDSASGVSFALVGAPMLNPRGLPSTRGNPGAVGMKGIAVVPPALKWQALQFLCAGAARRGCRCRETGSCPACQRALQLERLQIEVLLAAERQLICDERIQFFIGRDPEVHTRPAAQRDGRMLRDGHEGKVTQRRAVVSPAETIGRIWIASVGAEIDGLGRVLRLHRILQRLHVLGAAQDEAARRVEAAALTRIRPNRRSRSEFSRFDSAGFVSATNSGSLDGSVVMNAGSTVKLFVSTWQVPRFGRCRRTSPGENADGRVPRRSRSRRRVFAAARGFEPDRRRRVIDEPDLTMPEPLEERAAARQDEPIDGTFTRPADEGAIREEAGEAAVRSRVTESVCLPPVTEYEPTFMRRSPRLASAE